MISVNELESLKVLAEVQANTVPGGIIFGIMEEDTIVWVKSSDSLNIKLLSVGNKLGSDSTTLVAMRQRRVLSQNIDRSAYGIRLTITSIPIVDEEDNVVGAFAMAVPKLHPIGKSFGSFAPMLGEMFPEGAFLFTTDLNKIVDIQSSEKFDVSTIQSGDKLKEDFIASKVIKTGKPQLEQVKTLEYGVPVTLSGYPLFDEENGNKVVGSFCIIMPQEVADKLRTMSNNLEDNLSEISATIEQLAASASQIHTNEQDLNQEIDKIITVSEEINEISSFIKAIADETKMLGLNAAIEAARAGEAGKGFGVVAQEIRRLSEQSKSTVPRIKELTDNIKIKVEDVSKKSQSSLVSSQEQAAASQQITAGIEEITSMSEELNTIAQKL
ncbi:methyl-accepting chemotaxis protein [Clostridium botulinum]|uniref:methyl-accepting chemotaxis protein n=1 Tax=Clostridium botulinum TaxID=1491 RepID=UPI001A924949|nr:methyl-accepting chemotaxis protein [Clostridium botulinum]MBO0524774.1 methyl-accepting chemotaxis protein [Clostridium botulinum]MBO0527120.1 methyl-accepting chemotaxis protein [Clostridium botulinum]MBO0533530.1 methyl-accepting chemotaxis protein [Clostridium botulinum]MBO0537635.1 methyl-accepting chemotaxis protein [Clostridium botulinum]MBO0540876.1 methyl-accepting chemotaxis protein [Clostridium botulinum]